jgi:hypothetical protein
MNVRRAAVGLCAIVGGIAACQAQDPCAPTGKACGGDPSGQWTVIDGCREPTYTAPQPLTYYGQPDTTARQPPPEATSSDWCSYLVYDPTRGITNFIFPYDTLFVSKGGAINYVSDGTFAVLLATKGNGHVDLSAACLTRFGQRFASPSRCEALTMDLMAFAATEPSYQDINCLDDGAEGCGCTYSIAFEPSGGPLSGHWGSSGDLLTHFAGSKQLPSQADYCVDSASGTMTLWGHDRTDIWDQAGLRTLVLERMPAP